MKPLVVGLALLLVSCTASSPKTTGTVTASGPPSAQSARLDLTSELTFTPNHVLARVGTVELLAANTGQVPHNLVFDDKALGGTGTIAGMTTARLSVRFTRPGTFTFQCTFHPHMSGQVVVTAP